MAATINNEYGSIVISNNVISNIAGAVANNCYGVVGMAVHNAKDGIVSLVKSGNLNKGISVSVENDALFLDIHIVVQYGVNINAICESIMHNVKYQVSVQTGFEVSCINVFVDSMRVAASE
ncbi:MAG: Asp23/Gls24 family envelope stress response protein [Clostridia bacterium]|nr:Asp23/Gls24 family envelope stress response protein [Clostridia bacterium]